MAGGGGKSVAAALAMACFLLILAAFAPPAAAAPPDIMSIIRYNTEHGVRGLGMVKRMEAEARATYDLWDDEFRATNDEFRATYLGTRPASRGRHVGEAYHHDGVRACGGPRA